MTARNPAFSLFLGGRLILREADVDGNPGQPGKKAGEVERANVNDGKGAANGGQRSFVSTPGFRA